MENRQVLVHISLIREESFSQEMRCFGAVVPEGAPLLIDANRVAADTPVLLSGVHQITAEKTPWLRFDLSREAPRTTGEILRTDTAEIPDGPILMRLDQVTFPPGAIAYRHVHPGPGIRYLDQGKLTLQSDDHVFDALVGDSWFEPANTPVRATASLEVAQSRFIRFMALPVEFAGKSTLNILDPQDAERPKKQTTHRFFETRVHLDAG